MPLTRKEYEEARLKTIEMLEKACIVLTEEEKKNIEVADFGAFIEIGPVDGMIHISQTMDDFVSFSKSGVLSGKQTKKVLKKGDKCRARIIAVSYKDPFNPKIGLTMRQPWLGTLHWIDAEIKKKEKKVKKSG